MIGAVVLLAGQQQSTFSTGDDNFSKVIEFIDWDKQAKLPPWLCPIEEGSSQGVAIVLGQSLNPDGTAPQVLKDRALLAKQLLDDGRVVKVIVSGGDPAGVGHTEASQLAKVLEDVGINSSAIIQEAQATTTAENAWFALRWLPMGTGQLYIVTSDFHMPRATYIFKETLNYFYKMLEDQYRDDPRWTSETKLYPRLNLTQVAAHSFCGTNASLNADNDPSADVNLQSLRKRALNELTYLGDAEVAEAMYGEPLNKVMYIWPIQINVTLDPENDANFAEAIAQAMNSASMLCPCVAPPEDMAPLVENPLFLPIPTTFPAGKDANDWDEVIAECTEPTHATTMLSVIV